MRRQPAPAAEHGSTSLRSVPPSSPPRPPEKTVATPRAAHQTRLRLERPPLFRARRPCLADREPTGSEPPALPLGVLRLRVDPDMTLPLSVLASTRRDQLPSTMPKVRILSKSMTDANLLTISAGTNCPQGGDSGHGGRTVLRLSDNGGTCMSASVDGRLAEEVQNVEIVLYGDAESRTFIAGLEFAATTLRAQLEGRLATHLGECEEIA